MHTTRTTVKQLFYKLLPKFLLPVLAVMLTLGAGGILWFLANQMKHQKAHFATEEAQLLTSTINQFSNFYITEIMPKAIKSGMDISHEFKEPNTLPIPTTFVINFSEFVTQQGKDLSIHMYSNYQFPFREERVLDDFNTQAIMALEKDPETPYFRIIQEKGNSTLRYATALSMSQHCIDCHNTYPESPKTDWKLGDLRGVMEIKRSLNQPSNAISHGVMYASYASAGLILLLLAFIWLALAGIKKTLSHAENMEDSANIDDLTQVANRRLFSKILELEVRRLARSGKPLSLVILDVDYFKPFNDHYGHIKGDESLISIAKALQQVINRPGDLFARYGGEEFVAILPETDANGAKNVAENMRSTVSGLSIPHEYSPVAGYITISLGVISLVITDETPECLLKKADSALYAAKEQGRNRAVMIE